ncbi:hypothetical protein V1478_013853 [Vespula squamosa]|uniref:Uncharacterized protein n=1 Tax=Vespula squamosa TaxID=30214 RepID=A0ABD2A6B7_VESSQ
MRIIRPETSELDSGLCVATTKSTQISLTLPLLLERTSRYAMQIAILRCTGLQRKITRFKQSTMAPIARSTVLTT